MSRRLPVSAKWLILYLLLPLVIGTWIAEILLFFLKNGKKVFANRIIYPFWTWSFGHSIVGFDFGARLFYPHRISLILIQHPRSNRLLPYCFENIDPFFFESVVPPLPHRVEAIRFQLLRFFCHAAMSVKPNHQVINQLEGVYQTLSMTGDSLCQSSGVGTCLTKHKDWTGLIFLQRHHVGRSPRIPAQFLAECEARILAHYPDFFSKPFVCLHLRLKGAGGAYDDSYRSCGPIENYRKAVSYLTRNGYYVVGSGETPDDAFKEISGYYNLRIVGISPEVLNLFVLLRCGLFIGQQSGPFLLSNSAYIPVLLLDALPYRIGTNDDRDLILFKKFFDRKHGRALSYEEVFINHPDLAFGSRPDPERFSILPNTEDEILKAVEETLAIIRGKLLIASDDNEKIERFRKAIDPRMGIYYHGNRPPIFSLSRENHESFS